MPWLVLISLVVGLMEAKEMTPDTCARPCITAGVNCLSHGCVRRGNMVSCSLTGISDQSGDGCLSPLDVDGLPDFCRHILYGSRTSPAGGIFAPPGIDEKTTQPSALVTSRGQTPVPSGQQSNCISLEILIGVAIVSFASAVLLMGFCFVLCGKRIQRCHKPEVKDDVAIFMSGISAEGTRRMPEAAFRPHSCGHRPLLASGSTDSGRSSSIRMSPTCLSPQFSVPRDVTPRDQAVEPMGNQQEVAHEYETIQNNDYQEPIDTSEGCNDKTLFPGKGKAASSADYENLRKKERQEMADHDYASMCDADSLDRERKRRCPKQPSQKGKMEQEGDDSHPVYGKHCGDTDKHDYLVLDEEPQVPSNFNERKPGFDVKDEDCRESDLSTKEQHEYFVLYKESRLGDSTADSQSRLATSPGSHSYVNVQH